MMPEAGFGLSINSWDEMNDKYFVQPFYAGFSLSAKPHSSKLSLFGERRAESGERRADLQRELKILRNRSQDLTGSPRQHQSGLLSVPVPLLCWGAGSASSLNVLRLDLRGGKIYIIPTPI
jgi:hypothetical protein